MRKLQELFPAHEDKHQKSDVQIEDEKRARDAMNRIYGIRIGDLSTSQDAKQITQAIRNAHRDAENGTPAINMPASKEARELLNTSEWKSAPLSPNLCFADGLGLGKSTHGKTGGQIFLGKILSLTVQVIAAVKKTILPIPPIDKLPIAVRLPVPEKNENKNDQKSSLSNRR